MGPTRRRVLARLGVAVAGLAGCGDGGTTDPSPPETVAGTFPGARYDQANTGHVTDRSGPSTALDEWWTFSETEFGPAYQISTPVVGEEAVYVVEGGRPEGSSEDAEVRLLLAALEHTTGDVLWRHEVRETNQAVTPSVRDGRVVANMGGSLVVLDAADGDVLREIDESFRGPVTLTDDGLIYGYAQERRQGWLRSVVLEGNRSEWRVDHRGEWPKGPMAVGEEYVVGPGRLRVFERGSLEERHTIDADLTSAPAIDDGDLVAGTNDGTVAAWDLESGQHRWSKTPSVNSASGADPRMVNQEPAVTDDLVLACVNWALTAIDRESGEVRWNRGIEANGLPVVADGRVFVNGLHGVEVFDLDGGNRLGSHTWSVREGASPGVAVVDDICFAGGDGLRALI